MVHALERQISGYTNHLRELGFTKAGREYLGGVVYYHLLDGEGRKLYVGVHDKKKNPVNRGYVTPIFDKRSEKRGNLEEDALMARLLEHVLEHAGYEFVSTKVALAGTRGRAFLKLPWLLGVTNSGGHLYRIGKDSIKIITHDIDYITNVFREISDFVSSHQPALATLSAQSPIQLPKTKERALHLIVGEGSDSFSL